MSDLKKTEPLRNDRKVLHRSLARLHESLYWIYLLRVFNQPRMVIGKFFRIYVVRTSRRSLSTCTFSVARSSSSRPVSTPELLNGCTFASGGGITFMLYNGTVGYNWMTVPFTICGVLTFIYAVTAAYFAATHNLVRHRAWGDPCFLHR